MELSLAKTTKSKEVETKIGEMNHQNHLTVLRRTGETIAEEEKLETLRRQNKLEAAKHNEALEKIKEATKLETERNLLKMQAECMTPAVLQSKLLDTT